MNKKERVNYLRLLLILIAVILLTIMVCNLYRNHEENKGKESYLAKYIPNIKCSEISNAVTELNSNSFLYLTFTGSKDIYNLERELKREIKKNNLEDNIIYVDCTDNLNSDRSVTYVNELFKVGEDTIKVPAIIYFKDNNPKDYIDSKDRFIKGADFAQLLDKYEIKEN